MIHVTTEYVVLLDDEGQPCGQADKSSVHTAQTPLHLAFSCWLLDGHGHTLLTQRAATKATWPMAWTNSFCGHPAPGEEVTAAVRRRGRQELGVEVQDLQLILPAFRYSAQMPNGIRENEVCPVFVASAQQDVAPDPAEVGGFAWMELRALRDAVEQDPQRFSPWLRLQLPELLAVVGLSGRLSWSAYLDRPGPARC